MNESPLFESKSLAAAYFHSTIDSYTDGRWHELKLNLKVILTAVCNGIFIGIGLVLTIASSRLIHNPGLARLATWLGVLMVIVGMAIYTRLLDEI